MYFRLSSEISAYAYMYENLDGGYFKMNRLKYVFQVTLNFKIGTVGRKIYLFC